MPRNRKKKNRAPPTPTRTVAILAYATPIVKPWDPDVIALGIGGSEEAIIYAAAVLSKEKFAVTVFANPPEDSKWSNPKNSPCYVHADTFGMGSSVFDVIICWRRQDFLTAKMRAKQVFFWPHDIPPAGAPFPAQVAAQERHDSVLSGIFYLSVYLKQLFETRFPTWKTRPSVISGNGLVTQTMITPEQLAAKPATSCVYISNWARGLEGLLSIWPAVRAAVPDATLDIFYGTQTWGLWSPEKTNAILQQITLMAPLGVQNYGMVGHAKLDEALQKASVLAYPCNCYAETYCISVVKAQYWGVVPVTSRMGAMVETTKGGAPVIEAVLTPANLLQYRDLLIATLQRLSKSDTAALHDERMGYVQFAASKTWDACVRQWMSLFQFF